MSEGYMSYTAIAQKLPLQKGDIVLVSSDILGLMLAARERKETFDANRLIDSLQAKIGSEGTLLFPTYTWDFCQKKRFDLIKTPSKVGALTNLALKRQDFMRTAHPIYSFAVWGKHANLLSAMNNIDGWSSDSPFGFLDKMQARNLFLGIDYKLGLTLDHYAESECQVEYRYLKTFDGLYIDADRNESQRSYTMLVRDLETTTGTGISDRFDQVLKEAGCFDRRWFNGTEFSILDITKAVDIMKADINGDRKLIYMKTKAPKHAIA